VAAQVCWHGNVGLMAARGDKARDRVFQNRHAPVCLPAHLAPEVARLSAMTLPDRDVWIFSLKTYAGAMLALWCAMALNLDRPYWAMATSYIVAQPLTGAMRSKGVYRLIGTVAGALVVVGLVPVLVDAPELLTAALAGWTGLCLFVALLDRTPRSYVFMLAGYSAAIIGFPTTSAPGTIFDVALARVEEISLGIVCTIVIGSVILPRPIGPVVAQRIDTWLDTAIRWTDEALRGGTSTSADRRRLAADAIEIGQLSSHLAFDTSIYQRTTRWVNELQGRVLMLLPVLSSIEDRLTELQRHGPLEPALMEAIGKLQKWVADPDAADPDALQASFRALRPDAGGEMPWRAALTTTLLLRLGELLDLLRDARALRAQINAGGRLPPPRLHMRAEGTAGRVLHRDPGLALLSGLAAAIAVCAVTAFWIATSWPEGAVAAEMAAVGASFFAVQDDPVPAILGFAGWSLVACAVDAIYLFAILPQVDGFVMLALVLAPAWIFFGLLIAMPATYGVGMGIAANGATLIALQETYNAEFASFIGSTIALAFGLGAAALVTALIRSVGAEWSARRLLRAGWAELADTARRGADRAALAGRMLDRLGLVVPRLASAAPGADIAAADLLAELRIGLNIVDLRHERENLPPAVRPAVRALLDGLVEWFGRRRPRASDAPPAELLSALDRALISVWREAPQAENALLNLVGIRRGLFPDAAPPATTASR